MNKRQSIPFLILLCVFLLWLYLKPEKNVAELLEHHPNFIAYKVSNTHFDQMGEVSHEIFSDKATSFSEKDITVFEKPRLVVYTQNSAFCHVSSLDL